MKKLILLVLLVVFSFGDDKPPRFEIFYEQVHKPQGHSVEVWHDSETGQEFVCVYGNLNVPSCFLTGRSWK